MPQNPNTADQINSVVDHLASKLAVPASQLWAVLLRQSYVAAWQMVLYTVFYGIAAIVLYAGIRFCWRQYQVISATKEKDYMDILRPGTPLLFCAGLLSLAEGLCLSTFIDNLTGSFGHFTNPAFYAIRDILSSLK